MPSRRELLSSMLGASLAPIAARVLAGCDDDEARAGAAVDGTLLGPSMERGHQVRDGDRPSLGEWPREPSRRIGVAILGGGPAGLSVAWRLSREGFDDYRVLELEPRVGGTSVSDESEVTRYPWGAHYLPVPMAHNRDLVALLREMSALVGTDDRGLPIGAEELLVREPVERVFADGFWYEGLYLYAGASSEDLAELGRFRATLDRLVAMRDGRGRRAFALPLAAGTDDSEVTSLDRISAASWLEREGFRSGRLRALLTYGCRDDYGLSLEDTSAYAALWYYAARIHAPGEDTMELLAWPEGNGAIVRHLAGVAGERIETDCVVIDVEPREHDVLVRVLDGKSGRPETLAADRVVVAMPRFVARRVVRPLRDRGDEGFRYGAWMVANLHLSDRPSSTGYPLCWDNVLHDSPSLGYVCATHQRGRDFGPTVFSYYLPMTDGDAAAGRRRLLEPSWEDWKDVIVGDVGRAHPDLARHLRRLDVWRWGHGMIQPRVGFLWSEARRRACEPTGRVHFAHSDLSGIAVFEEAFFHGVRAADEILATRRDGGEVEGSADGEVAT